MRHPNVSKTDTVQYDKCKAYMLKLIQKDPTATFTTHRASFNKQFGQKFVEKYLRQLQKAYYALAIKQRTNPDSTIQDTETAPCPKRTLKVKTPPKSAPTEQNITKAIRKFDRGIIGTDRMKIHAKQKRVIYQDYHTSSLPYVDVSDKATSRAGRLLCRELTRTKTLEIKTKKAKNKQIVVFVEDKPKVDSDLEELKVGEDGVPVDHLGQKVVVPPQLGKVDIDKEFSFEYDSDQPSKLPCSLDEWDGTINDKTESKRLINLLEDLLVKTQVKEKTQEKRAMVNVATAIDNLITTYDIQDILDNLVQQKAMSKEFIEKHFKNIVDYALNVLDRKTGMKWFNQRKVHLMGLTLENLAQKSNKIIEQMQTQCPNQNGIAKIYTDSLKQIFEQIQDDVSQTRALYYQLGTSYCLLQNRCGILEEHVNSIPQIVRAEVQKLQGPMIGSVLQFFGQHFGVPVSNPDFPPPIPQNIRLQAQKMTDEQLQQKPKQSIQAALSELGIFKPQEIEHLDNSDETEYELPFKDKISEFGFAVSRKVFSDQTKKDDMIRTHQSRGERIKEQLGTTTVVSEHCETFVVPDVSLDAPHVQIIQDNKKVEVSQAFISEALENGATFLVNTDKDFDMQDVQQEKTIDEYSQALIEANQPTSVGPLEPIFVQNVVLNDNIVQNAVQNDGNVVQNNHSPPTDTDIDQEMQEPLIQDQINEEVKQNKEKDVDEVEVGEQEEVLEFGLSALGSQVDHTESEKMAEKVPGKPKVSGQQSYFLNIRDLLLKQQPSKVGIIPNKAARDVLRRGGR